MGKLPASQANSLVVSAYRKDEKEQLKKLLENYSNFPRKFKVRVSMFCFVLGLEFLAFLEGHIPIIRFNGIFIFKALVFAG